MLRSHGSETVSAQRVLGHDKPYNATVRKYLNALLFKTVGNSFAQIAETRTAKLEIIVEDALMSVFAMFFLKDPSLLAFNHRRKTEFRNLKTICDIGGVPCDTQMRTIVDPVPPDELRPPITLPLVRSKGKALENMLYLYIEEGYLSCPWTAPAKTTGK